MYMSLYVAGTRDSVLIKGVLSFQSVGPLVHVYTVQALL